MYHICLDINRFVVLFISPLAGRARSPTYRNGAQLGLDNNLLDLSIRQERFDLRFVLDVDYVSTQRCFCFDR